MQDPPDPAGAPLLAPGARLERMATGASWSEGPLWLPELRVLHPHEFAAASAMAATMKRLRQTGVLLASKGLVVYWTL